MDTAERAARSSRAEGLLAGLAERGVVAVATTFVDNAGIARVKAVPLSRFPHLAGWGVGFSPAFDYFRFDDWVAAPASGEGPVGDQRIVPDLDRVVVLAGQPGWAWSPGERWSQDGEAHPSCSRLLLRRQVEELRSRGLEVRSAFEIEWVVSRGGADDFSPVTAGAGYGMARLVEVSDYCRDVIDGAGGAGGRRRAAPSRVRRVAARALRRGRVAGRGGRHLGPGADDAAGGGGAPRLPHVVLAQGRPRRRRQRRPRAPQRLARRAEPDGRGRPALRADRGRGGVRGRGARPPAGPARGRVRRRPRRTSGSCRRTGPAPTRAGAWRTARRRCGW